MSNGNGDSGTYQLPTPDPSYKLLFSNDKQLWLWNFDTNQYDKVIQVRGNGDVTTTYTITDPAKYIDPSTNEIVALYRIVAGILVVCPIPSAHYFASQVDYFKIEVEYVVPLINNFDRRNVIDACFS